MLDDEDKERLDGILENLVNAIEDAHCNLENLRNVLISLWSNCKWLVLPDSI